MPWLKLLKRSRKLHKWVGVYVSILTVIWIVEMIMLPLMFNQGLPLINTPPSSTRQYGSTPPISMQQALQLFMEQHPDGLVSVTELDKMTYLPQKGVYLFANERQFLEWYLEAETGRILEYGFSSSRFVMEKGMLGWIHPVVTKIVKAPFDFLFIFLAVSGCYITLYSRRKKRV